MGESKDVVERIKLTGVCRICKDCNRYIYYGEPCVKETTSGSRQWHHVKCWEERNVEKEKQ